MVPLGGRRRCRSTAATRVVARGGGLAVIAAILLGVALLAPEQPVAQADICQRHNGLAACRVW